MSIIMYISTCRHTFVSSPISNGGQSVIHRQYGLEQRVIAAITKTREDGGVPQVSTDAVQCIVERDLSHSFRTKLDRLV